MKDYKNKSCYDVNYCKYTDWGYRKRTRIWTNLKGFEPKVCKQDCNSMDGNRHKLNIGHQDFIKVGDNVICLSTKELRDKHKDYEIIKENKLSLSLTQTY